MALWSTGCLRGNSDEVRLECGCHLASWLVFADLVLLIQMGFPRIRQGRLRGMIQRIHRRCRGLCRMTGPQIRWTGLGLRSAVEGFRPPAGHRCVKTVVRWNRILLMRFDGERRNFDEGNMLSAFCEVGVVGVFGPTRASQRG
jgi:hypothetical protein